MLWVLSLCDTGHLVAGQEEAAAVRPHEEGTERRHPRLELRHRLKGKR